MTELCEVVITAPDPEWLKDFSRKLIEQRLNAKARLSTDCQPAPAEKPCGSPIGEIHPEISSTQPVDHVFPAHGVIAVLEATSSTVASLGCAQHSRRICALCTHPCPLRDFVIGGVIFPAVRSRKKTRRTAALDVLDRILWWRR
jgi:hypothetical protein